MGTNRVRRGGWRHVKGTINRVTRSGWMYEIVAATVSGSRARSMLLGVN